MLAKAANLKANEDVSDQWLEEVKREIQKDPIFGVIFRYLTTGEEPSVKIPGCSKEQLEEIKTNKIYEIQNKILYRIEKEKRLMVVPISLKRIVLTLAHDFLQHFNWKKTLKVLEENFYFHSMAEITRRYVAECSTCQRVRNKRYFIHQYGEEIFERMAYWNPRKHLAMDIKSIAEDEEGYNKLIVIKDVCTRYIHLIPCKGKTKEEIIRRAYEMALKNYSTEVEILMDKGSEFASDYADALLKLWGYKVHFCSERSKESNGGVERFMRTFNDHFKKAMIDGTMNPRKWSQWTYQLEKIVNNTYDEQIAQTPNFLHNGHEIALNFKDERITGKYASRVEGDRVSAEVYLAQKIDENKKLLKIVRERFASNQKYSQMSKALHAHPVMNHSVGTKVLLELGDGNGGWIIQNRAHAGPFEVLERVSESNYSICGGDRIPVIVHGYKLFPYTPSNADMLGNGCLTSTAVGAAANRLYGYEITTPTSEGSIMLIQNTWLNKELQKMERFKEVNKELGLGYSAKGVSHNRLFLYHLPEN